METIADTIANMLAEPRVALGLVTLVSVLALRLAV
jgi:hypothetical protein